MAKPVNTKYDPEIIQRLADKLYGQAQTVVIICVESRRETSFH